MIRIIVVLLISITTKNQLKLKTEFISAKFDKPIGPLV